MTKIVWLFSGVMARSILAAVLLLACADLAPAAGTCRVVKTVLPGPRAPQGVRTEVVLAPGWRSGQAALLMVFLRDGCESEKSFRKHGLAALAPEMLRDALPPLVIASPRHRGTFTVDAPHREMESFVAAELVPALENEFPGASRQRRSVWGISRGGYGAVTIALLLRRGIAVDATSMVGARHRWPDRRAATARVLESPTT
jgi:hypothetical protein